MEIVLRPLETDADVDAFRTLNTEWIVTNFDLEDQDRRQLEDPVAAYIRPGGQILIAELDGERVGCVALAPDDEGAYELSKMAVAPGVRGRGIGRLLLEGTIAYARDLGATSLFLGSNAKLASAVHLYEELGFTHVAPETLHMPYARANVFMRLRLT
jgi:N-acetylglutamate synthase-like GNAT family acetyltransferase